MTESGKDIREALAKNDPVRGILRGIETGRRRCELWGLEAGLLAGH